MTRTLGHCRLATPIGVLVVAIMAALGTVGIAGGGPIVFDFEEQTATALPHNGALTSLSTSESGLTAIITRPVGGRFDIIANVASRGLFEPQAKPAEFGLRSLDPFFAETSATPFIVNFSMPVTSVSVIMGDYRGDTDSLSLQAFSGPNGTGTPLASDSDTLAGGPRERDNGTVLGGVRGGPEDFTFLTLTVAAQGINSIRMIGGSLGFPNSVFYDNLAVVLPPPPAALTPLGMMLLAIGLVGFAIGHRRKMPR